MTRALKDPHADRTCKQCKQTKPFDQFYASGTGNGRRHTCIRCIKSARSAMAGYHRTERRNARGEIYCPNCRQYLHADNFSKHPSRPGTYVSYCRPCNRVLDRIRYQGRKADPAWVAKERERSQRRKISARKQVVSARIEFIQSSLDTIRRRGLTLAEICRVAQISCSNVYGWINGTRVPSLSAEKRIAVVLGATAHLPISDQIAYKRKNPHPELELIARRISPEITRYRMRNAWVNGNKRNTQHKEAA